MHHAAFSHPVATADHCAEELSGVLSKRWIAIWSAPAWAVF